MYSWSIRPFSSWMDPEIRPTFRPIYSVLNPDDAYLQPAEHAALQDAVENRQRWGAVSGACRRHQVVPGSNTTSGIGILTQPEGRPQFVPLCERLGRTDGPRKPGFTILMLIGRRRTIPDKQNGNFQQPTLKVGISRLLVETWVMSVTETRATQIPMKSADVSNRLGLADWPDRKESTLYGGCIKFLELFVRNRDSAAYTHKERDGLHDANSLSALLKQH